MLIKEDPHNVSKEHYELSQIANYIAWKWGCRSIANEVGGCAGLDPFGKTRFPKGCIDAIGIKCNWFHSYEDKYPDIKVYGFEAKVSLSDFRGFCTACEYTYVIAPKGLIPISEIPNNIGLVEVDLDNYKIINDKVNPISFEGIDVVKRAKRSIANFMGRAMTSEVAEEQYKIWAWNKMISIARGQTVNSIFKNPVIEICKE